MNSHRPNRFFSDPAFPRRFQSGRPGYDGGAGNLLVWFLALLAIAGPRSLRRRM